MTELHVPFPQRIWSKINMPSVLTTVVMMTFWAGVLWNDNNNKNEKTTEQIADLSDQITKIEQQGKEQVIAAEGNFKVINSQIGDLPYRVGAFEKALEETNRRMDKLLEGVVGKMDKVLDNQNSTDVKLGVVSSQVEDLKRSIANKIVWREAAIFKLPWIKEVSLKPCYLPTRTGYTVVKSHYRLSAQPYASAAR